MSGEELIARLEKLSGPDREADEALALIAGCRLIGHKVYRDTDGTYLGCARFYTASMDAALTLVPKGYWWLVGCGQMKPEEPLYGAQIRKPGFSTGGQVVSDAEHNCMAIALCIAALRSRASKDGGGE